MLAGGARAADLAVAGCGTADSGLDVEGDAGTGLSGWLFAAAGGTDARSDTESDTGGESAGWLPKCWPELDGEFA